VSSAGGTAAQVIGKSGGAVQQAGVTLTVPANAVSQNTPITVTVISAPAGFTPASDTFQFDPDGTKFAQPVAVTIPLKSATPNAHVFWSNSGGGFDDIGGVVSGQSVTANVTHFSVGFAAVPIDGGGAGGAGGAAGSAGGGMSSGGAAGMSSTGGGSGNAGAGGASQGGASQGGASQGGASQGGASQGGASQGGASQGGASQGGASQGGASQGGASQGGASGTAGSGGASAGSSSSGAGGSSSGGTGGSGGTSLCTTMPLNLPNIKVTNTAGLPPDSSTYAGGTLVTGNYYETGVAHYGSAAYGGALQAMYKIDASALTIQIGERMNGQTYYVGMTYTQTDAHTLHVTVVCDTSSSMPATFDYDYTLVNSTILLTISGSSDVMTL